ncbi:MAG: bifunctional demethylmenaquinone methyltransferase/2-methoxy-6-polyprenyl-1,4-benzoquinol methylase UbiE [Deltaproteobacteria bacterium]|nr:bifunctional demethylmenaquinone methyltransferase/2-methoxy-6-polyprenyl-1,4-benzoquinol methylase UbiE [Deltaproteobacteria bacterium]
MFDRIAPSYDILNRILSLSVDRYWRKKTIQSLNIEEDCLVLDIATGTGDLALSALRDTGCRVVGIDLSTGMLEQAARKAGRYVDTNRYFLISGDAITLPFRDEAFDRAMVAFGIRNVVRLDECLDELYRIIKKGGMIAILELSVPSNRFFRRIYFTYFRYVLPVIGGIISGSTKAYRYLRDSVIDFLPPNVLLKLLEEKGFTVIDSHPFLMGISHLYTLKRDR